MNDPSAEHLPGTLQQRSLGIMQPYFFPYLGYWQLIKAVDKFVVYDNVKYTKKGWINRNRILGTGGGFRPFTLPLKRDSDFRFICEREVAEDFQPAGLLNQLTGV